jgi:hypothetical protein
MLKLRVFETLIAIKRAFIESLTPSKLQNYDGKSFVRKRSLTMERLVLCLLRNSPYGLQERIDRFFEEIGAKEDVVSKQAFSKARTKLDPDIVRESFKLTAQTLCSCEDLELYKGKFRLCAVDGSDITLDNAKELKDAFGCSGNHSSAAALASLCYDPLNDIILDGGLYKYGTSERDALREHFAAVDALPLPKGAKNLYIVDRGYPSKQLFAEMIDEGRSFLMRVRSKFSLDFDAVSKTKKVTFEYNGTPYRVHVFRVTLDSGESELLVTNLPDRYINRKEAAELYFKRWGIEIKFNALKNKLELENFSGRRVVTVYQDFWAKLDMANTAAALGFATDSKIMENTVDSENKHAQTTNVNRLISKFSEKYLLLMNEPDESKRLAMFDSLTNEIARRPVEVKPGRHSERKPSRKAKFSDRYKRTFR